MSEWSEDDLGCLATIEIGGTPARDNSRYWASKADLGYPWLSIADLGPRLVFETKEEITDLGIRNSNVKRVPQGTLLMSFKLTIGRAGIAGRDFYTNEAIAAFIPVGGRIDAQYLYYVLPEVARSAITDTAIKGVTLNKQKLRDLRIRFPSAVGAQKRIAEVLSTVDEAIEQTEALIAKTQQIKAGLMHDLFTRGVTPDGHLRPPREEAPHLYKESPLGWIPKEWDIQQWGKVTQSWAMGPRFSSSEYSDLGNVATLRTTDIDDEGRLSYSTMPRANLDLSGLRQHLLQPNDLVISRSGTCGISAVFEGYNIPVLPGAFLIRFRLVEGMCPFFLRDFLNGPVGARPVARIAEGGVQKNLRGTALCRLVLPIPSPKEQETIRVLLNALNYQIDLALEEHQKLCAAKNGLMHDLLTGRVRVNVSESASA